MVVAEKAGRIEEQEEGGELCKGQTIKDFANVVLGVWQEADDTSNWVI